MATAAAPMPNAQVRKAQRNLAAFRIHCGGLIHCGKEYSRRSQDEMFMMPNVQIEGLRAFAQSLSNAGLGDFLNSSKEIHRIPMFSMSRILDSATVKADAEVASVITAVG